MASWAYSILDTSVTEQSRKIKILRPGEQVGQILLSYYLLPITEEHSQPN